MTQHIMIIGSSIQIYIRYVLLVLLLARSICIDWLLVALLVCSIYNILLCWFI